MLKARSIKVDGVSASQFVDEFQTLVQAVVNDYDFVDTCWPDCAEAVILNELDTETPYRIRGGVKGDHRPHI